MLDRDAARALLGELRAMRVAGNIETLISLFSDDATFGINSDGTPAVGRQAAREALLRLIREFDFLEWRPIRTVVDKDEVAVRSAVKVRHVPSGRVVDTEVADFVTIKDGKISAYVQYVDTALKANLGRS